MIAQPPPITSGNVSRQFECWSDMAEWVYRYPKAIETALKNVKGEDKWAGGTWNTAQQISVSGWAEGAAKITQFNRDILARLAPLIERDQLYMDVYSPYGTYDMAAVGAGMPENAYNSVKVLERAHGVQLVRVVVNISASNAIKPEELIRCGCVIAGFVEACELMGRRCEVVMANSSTCAGRKFTYSTLVKNAQQPLDIALLAYQIAHPSVLRRWAFMLRDIDGINNSSYGQSADIVHDPTDIYFPALKYGDTSYNSDESARAKVMSLLTEQEVLQA